MWLQMHLMFLLAASLKRALSSQFHTSLMHNMWPPPRPKKKEHEGYIKFVGERCKKPKKTRWCMQFISLNKYPWTNMGGVAASPSWLHYRLHTLLPSKYPCFVYEQHLEWLSRLLNNHKRIAAGLMCRRDLKGSRKTGEKKMEHGGTEGAEER